MTRVAVVVQRSHPSITGGSEALAVQYAELLASRYEVDVLTTCALDYVTWRNELPPGDDIGTSFRTRRFTVASERSSYFTALHERLLASYRNSVDSAPGERVPWRDPEADEFIRAQGPHSPELLDYLSAHETHYAAIVFCTYLYPTSYFGAQVVSPARRIFVPTLHDEPSAYLQSFGRLVSRSADIAWLTEAERVIGTRLWNCTGGSVVGMAVDTVDVGERSADAPPYLLYCGRIDESKGSRLMLNAFRSARARSRDLRLVLTGSDHMGIRDEPGVEFLGFVDERRKAELMRDASAFVMPSSYESFSIVTLEAMLQRCPVLVNSRSEVLVEHVEHSGGGASFDGADSLAAQMVESVERRSEQRASIGIRGRAYAARYTRDSVAAKLHAMVEGVASHVRR